MAEKRASIIIELKDFVTARLKGVTDVFFGLKLGVEAFRQTFGRAIDFMMDSLRSFAQSEAAVNKLNQSLKNQGTFSESYSKSLQQVASDIQKVTAFSDEAVLETQALLTTFGLAGQDLNKTTKAALDLATGLGIDLKTATLILGKAWAGETSTLSRYGIKISETLEPAQKFEAVLGQINNRFGGSAEAALNTYAGRLANLTNRFDDLKEKIGRELLPVAEFWTAWITKQVDKLSVLADNTDTLTNAEDRTLVSIRAAIEAKRQEIQLGQGSLEHNMKLREELDKLVESYVRLTDAQKGRRSAPEAPPESTRQITDEEIKAREKAWEESRANQVLKAGEAVQLEAEERLAIQASANLRELENMGLTEEAKATLRAENMAAELEAMGQHEQAKMLLEETAKKNSEAVAKSRFRSTVTMLSMLAELSNAKNKQIAAVGKASAISLTMINAHVAAGQALAAFAKIPPLAIAMASVMYAAGAARAAQIAGVPLAEGGMLRHKTGGVQAIMAEAGHDEVAIPLDDERTTERLSRTLGPALGGGGANVTIQAGVIVADDMSLRDFAMRLDEELYRLGRARQRLSDG